MKYKTQRLRTKLEFDTVFKNCEKVETPHLKIYIHNSLDKTTKVGVIISSKFAIAVKRNLFRRRVKNILRKIEFSKSVWLVVIAKENILEAKFKDIESELKSNVV